MRTILHVDMDAFFASVEQLDDPSLRGLPVVVGRRSRRGVVAAASYEARRFGVRSAMPMVEALSRCPEAVVVEPHRRRYQELSAQVFSIFRRYTPLVEGLSLDEAFLDVTGSRALFGGGEQIARRIKREVVAETGLVCSAGVASNKLVAKIASDLDKPDGLFVVAPGEEASVLAPLPIERLPGVGPKTAARLHAGGFDTLGQLATGGAALEDALRLSAHRGAGAQLAAMARGEDERPVVAHHEAKSLGAERTLERDLHSADAIEAELLRHATRVASRLHTAGRSGHTVSVKLKYGDHVSRTRQRRLRRPVSDADSIYAVARELLREFPDVRRGVRLVGVTVGQLASSPPPELFVDETRARRERLADAVASVSQRFGGAALRRARLLGGEQDDSDEG